jgi:hypothetical protein
MATVVEMHDAAAGMAALSICESLMLALGDLKLISEHQAIGIIRDAATAHQAASDAATSEQTTALHLEVVGILNKIIAGGNSVRRLRPN